MPESHFKSSQIPSVTESDPRVVRTQEKFERSVEDFQVQNFRTTVPRTESAANRFVRSGPGESSPAAGNRFQLSQLTRDALGMGEEEQRRADEILYERIAVETELAKAIGIKEGYSEGLEKGRLEALEEHRNACLKKVERLDSLLLAMEGAKGAAFEANQKFLIDLSFRVGRAVLLRELTADRDYVHRLSKELIERMGLRENLTLKIHPDDMAQMEELKSSLVKELGGLRNLAVEASAEVRGGGAVLETEWGAIDASIDTQLAHVLEALHSPLKAGATE